MRLLEILACLLTVLPITLLILVPSRRTFARIGALFSGISLVAQCYFEGAHWQIGPLYGAGLILMFLTFSARAQDQSRRWKVSVSTAAFAAALVMATMALSWTMPMFRLPRPTGSYAVGTRIMTMIDSSRIETAGPSPSGKRELVVQAWYPASASSRRTQPLAYYQRWKEVTPIASYRSVLKTHSYLDAPVGSDGPYPVVLYNPGWQGERTEGTYQAEDLASHGFIVVAIDHTFYGGKVAFPDGRVVDSRNAPELGSFQHSSAEVQAALGAKFVHIEAEDDSFVITQLEAMSEDPASPWFHRIKADSVGAMGFSIGGAVAAQTAFDDHRVKSALNLDGWSFGDVQSRALGKPWMVLYEDKSQVLPTSSELDSGPAATRTFWQFCQGDFDHVTRSMGDRGGWILFLAETRHVDFTDRSLFSPLRKLTGAGTLDPVRTHAIVNAYTLAFFSHTLKGTSEPLLNQTPSPFQPVQIMKVGQPE